MRAFRRILFFVVFVGFLIGGWRFAHQNEAAVSIHYLFGDSQEIALWKVLGLAAAFGGGVVALVTGWALLRARFEARGYRKKMLAFERELKKLKEVPAAGGKGKG